MKPQGEGMMDFEQQTSSAKMKTSTRHLTKNDNKILGPNTTRKQEVVSEKEKYSTLKMKTHNSAWTPVVHKPSNEQIFTERRDLVSHWFDLWTDSQRKRFLDVLFQQCKRPQYKFVQTWFQDNVPLQHLDFTTVLPKFLSLYIFSFLDPKSLCRCSQVSWNWKFLSEQDVVWMPKCVKYGWFLPYNPPDNEYGAWKKYYLGCVQTPDYKPAFDTHEFKTATQPNDNMKKKKTKGTKTGRSGRASPTTSRGIMDVRPAWVAPSLKPSDLDKSFHAFLHGYNTNDPKIPKSALVYHNKWGILKKDHAKAVSQSVDFELGLGSQRRKDGHRILTTQDDHDIKRIAQRKSLSEVMDLENLEERRRRELVEAPWNPPVHKKRSRMQWFGTQTLSGYEGYPLPDDKRTLTQTLPRMISGYESYVLSTEGRTMSRTIPQVGVEEMDNPRVIFISSRVAAADLLDDAVLFGVIPIVYEYEGTTSEALMMKLERILAGRQAQSIGLFCHSEEPGELRLAHGCTVNLETLNRSDVRDFFEIICRRNMVPSHKGGQFDIFVPLAASEPGLDILVQLSVRCEMQFSSPTGIIGNYNHVNSDWLIPYKEERPIRIIQPPKMYFCQSKLDVWSNVADQAQEALSSCKKHLQNFFGKTHRDIVSQLTGQVVFDVLGQTEILGVNKVTQVLAEGLRELGNQDNINSLEFLGQYLLEKSGVDDLAFTSSSEKALVKDDYDDPDSEVEKINGHSKHPPSGGEVQEHAESEGEGEQPDYRLSETFRPEPQEYDNPPQLFDVTETARPEQDQYEDEDDVVSQQDEQYQQEVKKSETGRPEMPEKAQMEQSEKDQERQRRKRQKEKLVKQSETLRTTFGQMTLTGKYERLTTKQFSENPEKRSPIAFEILSSEIEYNRILKGIQNIYVKPLRAALNSNRAIASFQNIQIIFTDLLQILDASSEMLADLKDRMAEWDASQSCLGDIFVRFCTHLKLYTNFINNYDVILQCIERTKEQTPAFRAFLKRHERIPQLRMMTIQELLLLPGRRINEYAELLSWFERHTPSTHQDRADLANAIETLKVLNRYIQENKTRLERDRKMLKLQKMILNCPSLLEANRYLIKQQDGANLRPPSDSTIPELRVYQHIEMVGLFLFNDALVVTRRTDKHFPFTRAVEHTYRFDSSLALSRLRVRDIPESKLVTFGFKIETPKRALYCSVESEEEKFNFISLLEQSIRSAIDIE